MTGPSDHDTPVHKDKISGVDTTGHEWDGIRELDNPLPRWWLYIFYACILFAVGYWVLMPAWPGLHSYTKGMLGQSDRADAALDMKPLQAQRGAAGAALVKAALEQIEADPKLQAYALSAGASVFGDNCATCHGTGGTGTKGYPNLRDDVWIWGGQLSDIEHTSQVGVRSGHANARTSQMPAFGRDQLLTGDQINDLTEYVTALSRRKADKVAVSRAARVFQAQCAVCHGVEGRGNQAVGAPNLTDQDWLYGADRNSIHSQIWNARGGVMPSWDKRFDTATPKALTVYVYANANGR
jgi:cytochrome c oxidase cbb3-type subunit 3